MSSIDIIVPCYRYGHYLPACVASVLDQAGVAVRVLIIDDASPDDSAQVARRLAESDSRVEVRVHGQNRRHIATYNEGLEWLSAPYGLLLSADDMLMPGALLRATRVMDEHPEVGLVHGGQVVLETDPPSSSVERPGGAGYRILRSQEFVIQCVESASNPVSTPTAVVRTTVQKRIGGYRRDLPHTADLEMWLRFAAVSDVGVVDAAQAFKRMHGRNMQIEQFGSAAADLNQRRAAFATYFADWGRNLGNWERLAAQAQRALGHDAFWAASRAFDAGDEAACRDLLQLAIEWSPELQGGAAWRRLMWKRRLGPTMWRWLRPVVDRLRRTA
jgi:glycosyltransferase involved in cell wall biosynthesis